MSGQLHNHSLINSMKSLDLHLIHAVHMRMPSVNNITPLRKMDYLKIGGGQVVFCNPPYGRDLPKWVKKCHDESRHATIVMLIPARTDTSYFHDYIYHKAEIRFVRGRLKFGESKTSAPFPSMVVIYNNQNN